MTAPEVIDGEAVEEPEPTRALATVPPQTLAVTPSVKAEELVERLDVIKQAMTTAMTAGVDYGVIPGTGSKPTLLKPGAEKLGVLFQLDVQLENTKTWDGDHLTVESRATVYHAPTGARLGFGEGMCSTRERKYGKRRQDRSCPACGAATIIKGKAEYGGGWLCFKKKGGCGAKYRDGDQAIEAQAVGEIDNPDLPDVWNTCVKMAEKRARVDAVLAVTGASALFTQDVEDMVQPDAPSPARASEAQLSRLRGLFKQRKATAAEIRELLKREGVPVAGNEDVPAAVNSLTPEQASALISAVESQPVPTGESDVPGDVPWSPEYDPEESARIDAETADGPGGQFDLEDARAQA